MTRRAGQRGTAATSGAAADHGVPTVTGAHLARALDDLLDSAQGVTRTLLGVGVDPATLPAGGALGMSPHGHGAAPHGGQPRLPRLTPSSVTRLVSQMTVPTGTASHSSNRF